MHFDFKIFSSLIQGFQLKSLTKRNTVATTMNKGTAISAKPEVLCGQASHGLKLYLKPVAVIVFSDLCEFILQEGRDIVLLNRCSRNFLMESPLMLSVDRYVFDTSQDKQIGPTR